MFADHAVENKLIVERAFAYSTEEKPKSAFYVKHLRNPDFDKVRNANLDQAKTGYAELQKTYRDLPSVSSKAKIVEQLDSHEKRHPEECTMARVDITTEWKKHVGNLLQFVSVPAVHDASDDIGAKNSPLDRLMTTLNQEIEEHPTYRKFCELVKKERKKMLQGFDEELKSREELIAYNLMRFVDDAKIRLAWGGEQLDADLPSMEVSLREDGHESPVDRSGHGLQRAFIMAILQTMAETQQENTESKFGSRILILSIEEPELYQHPIRQRHMYGVLNELTKASSRQIVYTTHSPHFLGMDKLDHIRLVRKTASAGRGSRSTQVYQTSMQDIEESRTQKTKRPLATLTDRLKVIMTPWLNEGFFAKMVVLVEGSSDYAAVMGMARLLNHNLEAEGISVIPCDGKQNILYPFLIFTKLQIPVYVMLDLDNVDSKKRRHSDNRLLGLLGAEPHGTQICDDFACFDVKLESTIKEDVGEELFDRLLAEQKARFGMAKQKDEKALKTSLIMREVLDQAANKGHPCDTLIQIVKKIRKKYSQQL